MFDRCWRTVAVCTLVSALAVAAFAQAPGTPVPAGTWTMAITQGAPAESNGWEQTAYASGIKETVMFSQYHQRWSEPNESMVGYNFDTNSWNILDMGGLMHTENIGEGGESQGYLGYNPNNDAIFYHCCTTGSNQTENAFHSWWYDVLGQSGIDKHTSPKPPVTALLPAGTFDVAHNVFVMQGGDSFVGTWTYNPVANQWSKLTPNGTPPNASVLLAAMDYDSLTQKAYLFGGQVGSSYSNSLYYYDVPTNTWTQVNAAGPLPPARWRHGFAYDSKNNVFLLYGGQNASGMLGDTWIFNPATNAWTQLTPAQSPAIAASPVWDRLTYDTDHNAFVLVNQGQGGYFGGIWTSYAIQTWLFRYAGPGPNAGTVPLTIGPATGSINRNQASWAKDPALASSGNALYVAWAETGSAFDPTDSSWLSMYVSQYSGGAWLPLGNTFNSISTDLEESHAPSMAVVNGAPWVSWYQANNTAQPAAVFSGNWDGSRWQTGPVKPVGGPPAYQGRSQLTGIAGNPVAAFIEVDKSYYPQRAFAYAKAWNGTSWQLDGGPINRNNVSGTTADSISIATDGTNPYVAWTEYNHTYGGSSGLDTDTNPQVYVAYWDGNQWTAVGGSLNVNAANWAYDASIAYFGGQFYVAWTERTQAGNAELYVKTWNGNSWVLTGSGALNRNTSAGWAYHPGLVADAGTNSLYLGWVEQTALGQKAQVFVSKYVSGSWASLGDALNADPVNGSAQRVSLGVYNGQPVAAWGEVNLGALRQIYVKEWSGTSWIQLSGNGGAPDLTPPSTPTGLVATPIPANQINLSWTQSTDAVGVAGYRIYRGGTQVAQETTAFSYKDKGLAPGTYWYTVAAYDAAGNVSPRSVQASATTLSSDTTPPVVAMTSPASGATVNGSVTVSANARDNVAVASVQFMLDGENLGSTLVGSGPAFSTSWDTSSAINGIHTLSAIATDTSGNQATTTNISVTVNNGLLFSGVSATAITSAGATITWTTSIAADSQVKYGTTTAYGLTSTLNSTPDTSHSVALTGLKASTLYHYQALSHDADGSLVSSGDFTFTAAALGSQTVLQIHADASEVSDVTNGSIVTPGTAPAGFAGTVVVNGSGSVNYAPAASGNGVYFLNCCTNTGNAYYKFQGSQVGSIFKGSQGQISFYLQSRYSFAHRQASAASPRYAFDVKDANGHQFYFVTQVVSGALEFTYAAGGVSQFYFVPPGKENTLFGSGVLLQVGVSWSSSGLNLYLNGTLVKSSAYSPVALNWTAASNFDLGAYEYLTVGGYNISDDIIDEFTVSAPAGNTTPPSVSITSPAGGASLTGTTSVSATASGSATLTGVQFQLDGSNLGSLVSGGGPSYTTSWNTATTPNGPHTVSAIVTDSNGNSGNSAAVSVTVNNPLVISSVAAGPVTSASATITWTTNAPADSQVNYGTTATYGLTSTLNSTPVTSHSAALTGLTASTLYHYQTLSHDSEGQLVSSGDLTFTTAPAAPPGTVLQIHANASEVSGVTNGSIVTPGTAPAGFAGTVVVNGSGSVNYAPGASGNGVYFLNCCTNTDNAYYKFPGSQVGSIFKASQGQISFDLKSRYTFAQRQASAASPRYAFDVRDGNGHQFYFVTQIISGALQFTYAAGGVSQFYFVPAGMENTLFGNGVLLQVTLSWSSSGLNLYLDGKLVKSTAYSPVALNWTAASNFDLGAFEYLTVGGYYISDDIIDEFTVSGPAGSTTPPTVLINSPASSASLTGTMPVSATASGGATLTGVQFQLDGANLGSKQPGAGPSYTTSWNTATTSNGPHTVSAIATDSNGNSGNSTAVSVTVNNPLVISSAAAGPVTSVGAAITWTTNAPADSQVAYGTDSTYGLTSTLNSTLVTSHSVALTGLTASTLYHYQVLSHDSSGNLINSGDLTFTTASAAPPGTVLQIHADASEVSGVTNGSIVTPGTAPAGFAGTVVVNGSGSVNYAPAASGNGVYFLNCCANANNAYYKFPGAQVGSIFKGSQGQISFYLQSRYSFAQRQTSAASPRYAFDVRDANGHQFYFVTQVVSGALEFTYAAGGVSQFYFVPAGMENTLFGNGVLLQVTVSWSSSGLKLYLDGTLVKSTAYSPVALNWTAASNFDLGAYEYLTVGGYNISDDIIDEFTVSAP